MRTTSIIAIALLLPFGSRAAAYAQRSNVHPVGVAHEQLITTGRSVLPRRDTAALTPGSSEGHGWSETAVGAMVGGAVGLVASVLSYKNCADHSAGSEKGICGIAVMVIMPVAIGGGAIIGKVVGMVREHSAQ